MTDLPRLARTALLALPLVLPGAPARAETGPAPAQNLWDSMRAGTFGLLDYGAGMVGSAVGWLGLPGWRAGAAEESKAEDIRGLLNLSDKEFREFEALVRAAGFVLQGYSVGLGVGAEVELAFDFERVVGERERADLIRLIDQQTGAGGTVRRAILLGLTDAAKYVDAVPASGYRLAGVTMRLGGTPDVRARFRRMKP